ncbi:MAG TPA: hypothetical protein VME45_04760 [Stellaceae bacterium]|nr:hypothetical protein [Stellaceae bacterium]
MKLMFLPAFLLGLAACAHPEPPVAPPTPVVNVVPHTIPKKHVVKHNAKPKQDQAATKHEPALADASVQSPPPKSDAIPDAGE